MNKIHLHAIYSFKGEIEFVSAEFIDIELNWRIEKTDT